jgi:hypothetical protein
MTAATLSDSGEDIDLTLRHVSRRFPEDFARALLPPGTPITAATWLDTQVTARQRRLDRVLDVVAGGKRRLEHTEWQLEWEGDLPLRIFEYHVMIALAAAQEAGKGAETPPVRSTLVLLSGRDRPWPEEGEHRTSPPEAPFSGVTFRIDAVYQRTIAELTARDSPLWLVFAPLAVDADPEAMRRVLELLRQRTAPKDFDELAMALTVMADADRRQRGLRHAILPLLREEIVMTSWVYTQGKEKGLEEGRAEGVKKGLAEGVKKGLAEGVKEGRKEGRVEAMQQTLRNLLVRRLGRSPGPDEEQALARRAREVTPEQLVEVVEMPPETLLAWLLASG